MQIVGSKLFISALMPSRPRPPDYAVTVIVKGAFTLSPDGTATALEDSELARPTGDLFSGDDRGSSLRYPSDFAVYKPRADALLVGSCHAPNGVPVKALKASFAVGARRKTLAVVGERFWRGRGPRLQASDPRPFTSLQLNYEQAFGGAGFDANPVGRGLGPVTLPNGNRAWPLPTVEDPARLIATSDDRPAPAGFGPLPETWPQRRDHMGSYDETWLTQRWPGFPKDFDWGHFNAAPKDQQLDGYLVGDEELSIENLHPTHPTYRCRLPGVRPRCFLNGQEEGQERFQEVALNLDTLWVDMEAEVLTLVWRGLAPAKTPDHEEYSHLYLASERQQDAAASAEVHHLGLQSALAGNTVPTVVPLAEPSSYTPDGEVPGTASAPEDVDPNLEKDPLDAALQRTLERVRDQLATAGVPTASLASLSAGGDPSQLSADLAAHLGLDSAETEQHMAAAKKKLESDLSDLGLDPSLVDAMAVPPEEEEGDADQDAAADMAALDKALQQSKESLAKAGLPPGLIAKLTPDGDPEAFLREVSNHFGFDQTAAARFLAEGKARMKQELAAAGLDPATFDALEAEEEEEDEAATPAGTPLWDRISEGHAAGQSFAGEDLSGGDFSGMALKGVDFSGAVLAGAIFKGARLIGANFTGANLAGADLSEAYLFGARLDEADLQEADLTGADLSAASLNSANLSKAKLIAASLIECNAVRTMFLEADLSEARLDRGRFDAAKFDRARLDRLRARQASFRQASLVGARGESVAMAKSDLTGVQAGEGCRLGGSSLRQVKANGSIWGDSDLGGSDLSYATLKRADFTGGQLAEANLTAASARYAIFDKANLRTAVLKQADLMESRFERADLSQADLRGCNLYGAETWDAVLEGTRLTGANLKMTKLAQRGES